MGLEGPGGDRSRLGGQGSSRSRGGDQGDCEDRGDCSGEARDYSRSVSGWLLQELHIQEASCGLGVEVAGYRSQEAPTGRQPGTGSAMIALNLSTSTALA